MTLITDLQNAEKGSRELSDRVLLAAGWTINKYETAGGWPITDWLTPDGLYWKREAVPLPSPTENLQDALGLYKNKPEMVSSNPLKVCIDALVQNENS